LIFRIEPQASKMSDQDLCKEKVFQKFYRKHSRDLYNFMYYKSGNSDIASDLVQEAFIKIFENCSMISFSKARSYLFTTASNLFLNAVKHEKVKLRYNKSNPENERDPYNPDFLLQEKEYMLRLENAIANLTDGQREVFLLNRIDGKKYREIAEMLDISEKTVEKRMSGALKSLRQILENF